MATEEINFRQIFPAIGGPVGESGITAGSGVVLGRTTSGEGAVEELDGVPVSLGGTLGSTVDGLIVVRSDGTADVLDLTGTADGDVLTYNSLADPPLEFAPASGGGGSGTIVEVEVDFGSSPVYSAAVTVTDADVTLDSIIAVWQSGNAATGRTADDSEFDALVLSATPGEGQFTLRAVAIPGPIVGPRNILYMIGV